MEIVIHIILSILKKIHAKVFTMNVVEIASYENLLPAFSLIRIVSLAVRS